MWTRMQQLMQEEVTVRVKVESANRGGLLVKYGPFDGFVPVGQFGQVGQGSSGALHTDRGARTRTTYTGTQACATLYGVSDV